MVKINKQVDQIHLDAFQGAIDIFHDNDISDQVHEVMVFNEEG